MGQQQAKNNNSQNLPNLLYEFDIRLLEKIENYASSFPSDIEQILTQAEQFYLKQPDHFLIQFLISEINERFNSLSINKEAMNNIANSKTILEIFQISPEFLKHQNWYQLQSPQKFLSFLENTQEKYWIQQQLYQIIQKDDNLTLAWIGRQNSEVKISSDKNTLTSQKNQFSQDISIRKPFKRISSVPNYKTQLRQPLFKKLFFHYYFELIRSFCSSKNSSQRSNAVQFHVNIGRNILKIVSAQYISEQKLFQLLYDVVKIEKTSKSLVHLQAISQEYESQCLRHQHSITIEKNKLQKIKLLTKCYLDEMYFLAIKEAQDPQIIQDDQSNDSGLMLKNFPINRVKEKNRNM